MTDSQIFFGTVLCLLAVGILLFTLINIYVKFDNLAEELKNTKQKLLYKILTPQIEEYAKLKGYSSSHFLYQDYVLIGGVYVELNKIEDKLKDLKDAIEKNCPKKCKGKTRGKV